MSRRNPQPGGLRVDLIIDDPDLAGRLQAEAKRSGSPMSEVIRIELSRGLPPAHASTDSGARAKVVAFAAVGPAPGRPPEELSTGELQILVDQAFAAFEAERDPTRKGELQTAHWRLARVLGPRRRAERDAAMTRPLPST